MTALSTFCVTMLLPVEAKHADVAVHFPSKAIVALNFFNPKKAKVGLSNFGFLLPSNLVLK